VPNGHGKIVTTNKSLFNPGAIVTLQAVPDEGYEVRSWTGTDNDASAAVTNVVTMDSNKTVTVEFAPIGSAPAETETASTSPGICGSAGMLLVAMVGILTLGLISTKTD